MHTMTNSVNGEVVSFDSAFEEAPRCLSKFDMSRIFKLEYKEAISSPISGKNLLSVLPIVFGKSLI